MISKSLIFGYNSPESLRAGRKGHQGQLQIIDQRLGYLRFLINLTDYPPCTIFCSQTLVTPDKIRRRNVIANRRHAFQERLKLNK
jgi:hypothetical protein